MVRSWGCCGGFIFRGGHPNQPAFDKFAGTAVVCKPANALIERIAFDNGRLILQTKVPILPA
jgi:hypothetical protein